MSEQLRVALGRQAERPEAARCTWDGVTANWVHSDGNFHSKPGAVTQRKKEMRQMQQEAAEHPININGYAFSMEAFNENSRMCLRASWLCGDV